MAAYAGGRIVDDYVGVKAIAPSLVLVAPSGYGRVWSLAFTGAFFLTGAYRIVLFGFAQSFARIPLGGALRAGDWESLCDRVRGELRRRRTPGGRAGRRSGVRRANRTRRALAGGSAVRQLHACVSTRVCGGPNRHRRRRAARRADRAGALDRRTVSDASEKVFDATPSRIAKARREGNVARSSELAANCAFAAAALAASASAPLFAGAARVAIGSARSLRAIPACALVLAVALVPVRVRRCGGCAGVAGRDRWSGVLRRRDFASSGSTR